MSFSHQNGKRENANKKGYKEFYQMIHSKFIKTPWRHFGVYSFYDTPILDSEEIFLSTKEVLLAIAAEIANEHNSLIFAIDVTNESQSDIQSFIRLFRVVFPKSRELYFGPRESENSWLQEFEMTKIPLNWLIRRPDMFARAITDASPLGETLGPADVSFEGDLNQMREVLIEKLGPPSLSDEVFRKIRNGDAGQYAGEAVGIATAVINPAVAVSRGVRYLSKFVRLVRKRRQREIKELHYEWRQKVENAFSEDNLTMFFDTSPIAESNLLEAVSDALPVLLLIDTKDTLYDVFMPLLLNYITEEMGYKSRIKEIDDGIEEIDDSDMHELDYDEFENESEYTEIEIDEDIHGIFIFFDYGTHFSNFQTSFRYLLKIADKYANISLSASFHTNQKRAEDLLSDAFGKFTNTRAIVFDLHPALFDLVTSKTPVTTKAWLQNCLREIKAAQQRNAIAFLEYNSLETEHWKLRLFLKDHRGVLGKIRTWIRSK